jgi:hypothetical protein
VESGEGSNGRNVPGERIAPDEMQLRIARDRVARGLPPDSAETPQAGQPSLIGAGVGDPTLVSETTAGLTPAADPVDVAPRFRPWSEPAPTDSGPIRCHFLRSVGPDGRLSDPQNTAVPTHRCAAFGEPLPLSLRQQELVCLQRVHVSCPRYVRGTVLANETATPVPQSEEKVGFPLMTVAAAVVVMVAVGILLAGPVLGVLPFGGGNHQPAIIAITSPSPSRSGSAASGTTGTPLPSPSLVPSAVVTPSPAAPSKTPTPTPTPKPTSTALSSWPPGATASRMNLLVPCTDQPNCYLYTVRGAGENGSKVADTLANVVNFFGVDLTKVRAMNPWLNGSNSIAPGDKLKIPPPTK